MTSLLHTEDPVSWRNIEGLNPRLHGPNTHIHTAGDEEWPLYIFLKSKKEKKKRSLTFDIDSSLEVQILFLWSQGEVNGSHHGLPRPLTYLASLQTLSGSAAADKPSVQPLTIW